MSMDTAPEKTQVQFNCAGTAVGKMRNELVVEMVKPFHESFEMATDEGAFHGGDASAPPPLALFVGGLTGCLMTQIRAFAKRLGVTLDDLKVETRVIWDWQKAGRVYETAPHSFEIDVLIDSPNAFEDTVALVKAAQKGCFLEQTLGQQNTIRHRVLRDGTYVDI
ncbi:MAG: OsmC family protein [Rhodobacteraceae bacterium]|nr:OsmC family protein [Paracoccaceae bacterium]